jgi:hypothetical protein
MNEWICIILISLILLIVIYYIFDYNDNDKIIYETFEDKVETDENKSDEKQSICVKPFSVTYDKDKLYAFLVTLDDKITGMEYKMRMRESDFEDKYKDKFDKYDKMYKWYALKTKSDAEVSQKHIEEAQANARNKFAEMVAQSKTVQPGSTVKADLSAPKSGINDLRGSMMTAAGGDKDNKGEIMNAMNDIGISKI